VDRSPAVADGHARHERGSRRRQQILDAAVDLFASRGFRRTGVNALAERVGMTATGLLYYFGTKERLLHEVVSERDRAPGLRPEELTLANLGEIGRHNAENATLTRLYVTLGTESIDPDEPLHEFFVERQATARRLVRDILEAEQRAGTVRADVDLDQVSREVIGMLMGIEAQWLINPGEVDLASTIRAYVDRLVVDLAPNSSRASVSKSPIRRRR